MVSAQIGHYILCVCFFHARAFLFFTAPANAHSSHPMFHPLEKSFP